ncbi:substrate-binding periplasmic protein [Vogesella urethralis]|uniref:substrate-binding periplasmic protein n=1 Tax=Vogesella urethralis TaxID=2592656 RepID=UPI0014781083|nr:transporter substrate-binding domain-containing protein [Vogesella urethralis]
MSVKLRCWLVMAGSGLLSTAVAQSTPLLVDAADIPPFSYQTMTGDRGIALDILREAAAASGVGLQFRFLPWLRAQAETRTGRDRLIIPLTRTPEREAQYTWLAKLCDYRFVLFSAGKPPPATLGEARKLRIAVLRSNPAEALLRQQGFTRLEANTSEDTNARMLAAGRVDAWVAADIAAMAIYREAGGDVSRLRSGPGVGEPMAIYLAASPGYADPQARVLADAINRLQRNGATARIVARYRSTVP